MSTITISPLRQRMIEDLNARKLGAQGPQGPPCHAVARDARSVAKVRPTRHDAGVPVEQRWRCSLAGCKAGR